MKNKKQKRQYSIRRKLENNDYDTGNFVELLVKKKKTKIN